MRGKPISLLSVVALLTVLLAITAIWTQIVPQYRAKAELRVRPVIPRLVFPTDQGGEIPFYDSLVNTQLIKKANRVLARKRELFDAVRWHLDQKQIERNAPRPLNDRRILYTIIVLIVYLVLGSSLVFLQRTRMGDEGEGQRQ